MKSVCNYCFPILTKSNNSIKEQVPTNTIEHQLYGHDKILAEHHMTETEAWAELNRLFKEQENKYK